MESNIGWLGRQYGIRPMADEHPQALSSMRFQFDHIGVAVADIAQAAAVYADLFGYEVLAGPFEDSRQQATVAFLGLPGSHQDGSLSEFVLELIAPLDDSSHVARLLANGGGAYHVCYEVNALQECLEEMRVKGCLIVRGPEPAEAYQGRPIAWIYTPTRQLIELVQR